MVVPDAPALIEIQREVGSAWVQTYEGDLDGDTLVRARQATVATTGQAPLDAYNWDTIGQRTTEFFRRVVH